MEAELSRGGGIKKRNIRLSSADARMIAHALEDYPDGASMHPGWAPNAQEALSIALAQLRLAVIEDAMAELAAYNTACAARRAATRRDS